MSEEVVETEGYQPMTPERKLRVDKAKRNAYDNDQRAQHQGDSSEADKQFKRRMAMDSKTKMRKEELEATGLFSEKEIAAIEEAMSSYDKNRKRAAQRAADRNAARAAGKTGVVPGVGYVTPTKERETYTDEKGTTRHKSGAKMP
jgi:predicted amidohydrolase YtcJ